MPKDKEDREVLKGGLISEKIRQGLIRMPFNKREFNISVILYQ